MNLVLGIVGEKGAGKDTFVLLLKKILTDKKIAHIRFSDHLRETLDLWHIPKTRENLQKLAVIFNEGYGDGTVADAVFARIKDLREQIICVDGVRWETDVKLIKKFPRNKLIYITAEPKTRFDRLKKRGEKVGEAEMDYSQFVKEEGAKNEVLIPQIGSLADFKIINEGSIENFEDEIRKIANLLGL